MEVELQFFATVRDAVGVESTMREFPSGTTVGEVLEMLESEHPDLAEVLRDNTGELAHHITILRNGEQIANLDGLATELNDGDELAITPPRTGP